MMTAAERAWADRRQRQLVVQADAMAREAARGDLPAFLVGWHQARQGLLIEEANWLRERLGLPTVPRFNTAQRGGIDNAA